MKTHQIPVIALSANAIPRTIEKGLEAGLLLYVTKPIKIYEFWAALDLSFETALKTRSEKSGKPASEAVTVGDGTYSPITQTITTSMFRPC